MLVLLIRHGETVDNVASLYAGVSDSKLTNQGVLQASRLAASLYAKYGILQHIFTSDLQRAHKTGQAIANHQANQLRSSPADDKNDGGNEPPRPRSDSPPSTSPSGVGTLTVLPVLREQDFGSLELQSWKNKPTANETGATTASPLAGDWRPPESRQSMDVRADEFIDGHLLPLLDLDQRLPDISGENDEKASQKPPVNVAIVSHGILLSRLWKRLLARCQDLRHDLSLSSEVEIGPRGIEHLGSWSNTGYLVLRLSGPDYSAQHSPAIQSLSAKAVPILPESAPLAVVTRNLKASFDRIDDPAIEQGDSPISDGMSHYTDTIFSDADTVSTSISGRISRTGLEASHSSIQSTDSQVNSNSITAIRQIQSQTQTQTQTPTQTSRHGTPLRIHVHVEAVNVTDHCRSLKRARGIAGAAHDERQKPITAFFKRPKKS